MEKLQLAYRWRLQHMITTIQNSNRMDNNAMVIHRAPGLPGTALETHWCTAVALLRSRWWTKGGRNNSNNSSSSTRNDEGERKRKAERQKHMFTGAANFKLFLEVSWNNFSWVDATYSSEKLCKKMCDEWLGLLVDGRVLDVGKTWKTRRTG